MGCGDYRRGRRLGWLLCLCLAMSLELAYVPSFRRWGGRRLGGFGNNWMFDKQDLGQSMGFFKHSLLGQRICIYIYSQHMYVYIYILYTCAKLGGYQVLPSCIPKVDVITWPTILCSCNSSIFIIISWLIMLILDPWSTHDKLFIKVPQTFWNCQASLGYFGHCGTFSATACHCTSTTKFWRSHRWVRFRRLVRHVAKGERGFEWMVSPFFGCFLWVLWG